MIKKCISKEWSFSGNGVTKKVDLPHDCIITLPRNPKSAGGASNGFFDGAKGCYSKFMYFDEAAHTILDIDGAYMCARIYFNDNLLDMHPYGYTPYLVDLSGKIRFGRSNKIDISVLNVQPSTRWYSGSGIYRDVYVWTGGKTRIEPWDLFVSTNSITDNCAELSIKYCITSDLDCQSDIIFEVSDKNGNTVLKQSEALDLKEGKNNHELILNIKNAELWSPDSPVLYKLTTKISVNGELEDTSYTDFGIRTISADSKNGLLLNGKSIKLKGGCIHHDHGVLGSAEFPTAVYRKLSLLKNAGYNAVRTAHYPPSLTFLETCDKLGMLVMDEAFDIWNEPKNDLDYSLWFRDWWQRDISYMVLRDRNHPCVISYSIGNEIPERDGRSDGAIWSRKLSDEIRKYDNTRLVTEGICNLWEPYYYATGLPEDYDFIKFSDFSDPFGEITAKGAEPLDIVGYNYLYERYEQDSKKFPDRVIWGSETYAITLFDSWSEVMSHPNVIGDFTWTAYDNLGEAGTGRYSWGEDGYINGISLAAYPWRSCFQGDFDLCGFRRPQSYFREAVWKNITSPHIFTTHPKHNGDIFSGTGWHWYDVSESWTFDDEYIGKPVKTDVYTTADEIIFFLNGTEIGRAVPVKGIASVEIPYQKGEVTAIAVRNGIEEMRFSLKTTEKAYKVKIVPESDSITADNRELCYYDIFVVDENDNLVTDGEFEIECELFNGELLGVFSGNPCNEDQYGSNKCHTFCGKAVAIVKCRYPGNIKLIVSAKGLKSCLDCSVTAVQ